MRPAKQRNIIHQVHAASAGTKNM